VEAIDKERRMQILFSKNLGRQTGDVCNRLGCWVVDGRNKELDRLDSGRRDVEVDWRLGVPFLKHKSV